MCLFAKSERISAVRMHSKFFVDATGNGPFTMRLERSPTIGDRVCTFARCTSKRVGDLNAFVERCSSSEPSCDLRSFFEGAVTAQ